MTDKVKTTFNMKADYFSDRNSTGIFDDKRHENCSDEEKIMMSFALSWLETTTYPNGELAVYAPGPITGGQVAYDAAKKIGVTNIADLPAKLSADEFFKQVIQPNIQNALKRGRVIQEQLYPQKPVINPIGAEGSVRLMKALSADGKKWGQDAFMGVWLTVIERRVDTMVIDADWSKSNGSIQEVTHATLIQAGLRPSRPDADMKIVDLDKNPVSLFDRVYAIAQEVLKGTGAHNGFEVPVAATSLARLFHIHEMIKSGQIDPQVAHVDLFNYDSNTMEAWIANVKPVLLEKCIGYMDIKDLGPEYAEAKRKASKTPANGNFASKTDRKLG